MDTVLSRFQYNQRKLKILLGNNVISREHFTRLSSHLKTAFNDREQPELEELLNEKRTPLLKKNFLPILNKELFKYNQILIKLAQQFSRNTLIQQLKLQEEPSGRIKKKVAKLEQRFARILKTITDEYLQGNPRNIDDILLESEVIQTAHLEFLHSSALHLEIKVQDRKFGELAVKNHFVTRKVVNEALTEQTQRYQKTKKNHIIGDILVEQKQMTPEVRDEILIIQNRVLEEDWEETLKSAGQSSIEEKEKNALFGALVVKENLLDEKSVVAALQMQAKEMAVAKADGVKDHGERGEKKPRWIGDILVDEFGLAESDRNRIVKKQMAYRIERINLKLGLNLSNAHVELFNEMDQYFRISYSKERIEAHIELISPLPATMTKENIRIWLYHKKISYGRVPGVVEKLYQNKIPPDTPVLLAKGDAPVPAKVTPEIHFKLPQRIKTGRNGATPPNGADDGIGGYEGGASLVRKGAVLITLHRKKGRSGLNVNNCLVAHPLVAHQPIIKGENVEKTDDDRFEAACDGVALLSSTHVISVQSNVVIQGDLQKKLFDPQGRESVDRNVDSLSPDRHSADETIAYACDFHVKGSVHADVSLRCRSLSAQKCFGKVSCSETVEISQEAIDADIHAKGAIGLSSVVNCMVTGERGITIQLPSKGRQADFNRIYDSVITSDDVLKISDAKIVSSVIRARNRLILKKVVVGQKSKFVVGDSLEAIAKKTGIEALNSEISELDGKIRILQQNSRALFDKIEKKDIAAIDEEIKSRIKRQRTKSDLDKIAELRLLKRQKEKQYSANIDEYGAVFMQNANQIKALQKKRNQVIEKRDQVEDEIRHFYESEPEVPELNVRSTLLPAGTIIQFRYNQKVLNEDCEGFVFRETLNSATQRYEIKNHRW